MEIDAPDDGHPSELALTISQTETHLSSQTLSQYPITKSKFDWELIPFELREKIFGAVIIAEDGVLTSKNLSWSRYFRWTGVMPALVIAVRSLPKSHTHAMQLFARTNNPLYMGGLDREKGRFKYFLNNMTKVELGFLNNMRIALDGIVALTTNPDRRGIVHNDKWHDPAWFTKPFLLATNLRVVTLSMYSCPASYNSGANRNVDPQMTFLTEFPFWLSGCKALSKVVVELPYVGFNRMKRGAHRKIVRNMIQRIYEKTGVKAKYNWWEDQQWIWKAVSGKYMDWSQELGLRRHSQPFASPIGFWSLWEEGEAEIEFRDGVFLIQNSRAHYDDWGRLEV